MTKFLGKKLLIAVAHPDDETFLAAGTIIENRKLGGRNFIVCATLGEKGKSHLDRKVSDAQLKKIRQKELFEVSKFLKVDDLEFLKMPDTGLNKLVPELERRIHGIAAAIRPDYILSFGADGISGHLDHIAIGKAAKRAAKRLKIPFVAFAAPPQIAKNAEIIKSRRAFGKYIKNLKHAKPDTKIKINAKLKRKALAFHKSQIKQVGSLASMMEYEYFVVKNK